MSNIPYDSSSTSSNKNEPNINIIKDVNLSKQIGPETEVSLSVNNVTQQKAEKRTRKMSVISIPAEVEGEDEVDDEFLFIRLKKQIRNHWKKITEHYPNGKIFFRPNLSTESMISEAQTGPINSQLSEALGLNQNVNMNDLDLLIGGLFKSIILLPVYACKRDDEGRRTVPLISSLLQVHEYNSLTLREQISYNLFI